MNEYRFSRDEIYEDHSIRVIQDIGTVMSRLNDYFLQRHQDCFDLAARNVFINSSLSIRNAKLDSVVDHVIDVLEKEEGITAYAEVMKALYVTLLSLGEIELVRLLEVDKFFDRVIFKHLPAGMLAMAVLYTIGSTIDSSLHQDFYCRVPKLFEEYRDAIEAIIQGCDKTTVMPPINSWTSYFSYQEVQVRMPNVLTLVTMKQGHLIFPTNEYVCGKLYEQFFLQLHDIEYSHVYILYREVPQEGYDGTIIDTQYSPLRAGIMDECLRCGVNPSKLVFVPVHSTLPCDVTLLKGHKTMRLSLRVGDITEGAEIEL